MAAQVVAALEQLMPEKVRARSLSSLRSDPSGARISCLSCLECTVAFTLPKGERVIAILTAQFVRDRDQRAVKCGAIVICQIDQPRFHY
jgi:hypothetical protein